MINLQCVLKSKNKKNKKQLFIYSSQWYIIYIIFNNTSEKTLVKSSNQD